MRTWCLGVVFVMACSACAPGSPSGTGARATEPSGELAVFAAASLTDAFEAIGERFTLRYPEVELAFNFAGSSTLATQIVQGAPADVFAPADAAHVDEVADAGLVDGQPVVFARNRLAIAVEPGNPHGIDGLADLARDDLTVVLAAEEVPAGAYARDALAAVDVEVQPASREPDVRAVLSRVALGEADAGIVYASDVVAAEGDVESVAVPPAQNVAARYPIATIAPDQDTGGGDTGDGGADAADAFVAFVTSGEGRDVLDRFGFGPP